MEAIKNALHVVVGSGAADRHLVTISQAVIYRLCKLFVNAPLINTLELAFEAESARVHCCSIDTKQSLDALCFPEKFPIRKSVALIASKK